MLKPKFAAVTRSQNIPVVIYRGTYLGHHAIVLVPQDVAVVNKDADVNGPKVHPQKHLRTRTPT